MTIHMNILSLRNYMFADIKADLKQSIALKECFNVQLVLTL